MKVKVEEYPFLEGIARTSPVAQQHREDVRAIRSWLIRQPHLPHNLTDGHILVFLHSNYYSLEKTKATMESYYVVRAENLRLFTNWNMDELEKSFKLYEMVWVDGRTPDGYMVLVYRLKDLDPSKIVFEEALRCFLAFNDAAISEHGLQPGYVVIFDMKGCTLSHLARVTTALHLVRVFMIYIQECHPVRLKGVHVINTVSFMDRVLSLVKPLMQSELIHLLHLHTTLDTLKEFVPLSLLPSDYGGSDKPVADIQDEIVATLRSRYSGWLADCGYWVADLKRRPGREWRISGDMEGSFRSLNID